ncbi:MAG: type IIL restriction-modification enzyme MmeI [Verrucomicrobiia bacterium]
MRTSVVLSPEERADLIASYPNTEKWIRPFLGSEEFINSVERFCLWLKDVDPAELRKCPPVLERIEKCREERLKSVDANTRRWAAFPSLFQADRQPDTDYLVVPKVSSERRRYVPLGFMPPTFITNPSILVVPNATLYHLGVLSAAMHMAWMRQVCGRMKSDYQYSNTIVYNNFPWPSPTAEQRERVEEKARAVLAAREPHLPPRGLGTLADLYDPLSMPPTLAKAHAELDRAVEKCYRPDPFDSDRQRVEFLFALYEKLTAPLLPVTPGTRNRRSQTTDTTLRPRKQRTPALPGQNPPIKT